MLAEEIRFQTFQKPLIQEEGDSMKLIKNQSSVSSMQEEQFEIKACSGENCSKKKFFFDFGDQNMLSSNAKHEEWTIQQERILMALHNEKGNKWVEIARFLHRSDNSVKNHYHSKLRKALRKINKCITDHLKGQYKPFKNNLLSRIVQTAQTTHSSTPQQPQALLAFKLKNDILAFSELSQQQITFQQINHITKLISQICEFNKKYKKQEKTLPTKKISSNKYKGKEIISLLSENSGRKESEISKNQLHGSFLTSNRNGDSMQGKEKSQKQDMNTTVQNLASNCINHEEIYNSFYLYNQQLNQQLYSLYFSVASSTPSIYSGKTSSFSYYTPQNDKISQQMTTWASMGQIECDSSKSQSENGSLLRVDQSINSNKPV